MITIRNEEHVLILAFGTFWFGQSEVHHAMELMLKRAAMLVLWRAMHQSGGVANAVANVASTATGRDHGTSEIQRDTSYGSGAYPSGPWGDHWPCSRNDRHCIVEEWAWY